MNYFRRSWVLLVLFGAVIGRAATDDKQQPDREMLRMMDFLREMEMLKQMEILRDMHARRKPGRRPGKKHPAIETANGA